MKKILAIHSGKVFFKEDAPNFYGWLCECRGLARSYLELKKIYADGQQGTRVLRETFSLAISGLTLHEFERYVEEYTKKYQIKEVAETLRGLSERFNVMIFSSFPRLLFQDFDEIVYKIFGVNYLKEKLDEDFYQKIKCLAYVKIDYTDDFTNIGDNKDEVGGVIKQKFDKLGLKEQKNMVFPLLNDCYIHNPMENCFYFIPNRYGLFACLAVEMIKRVYGTEDVIVLGKGASTKPMHQFAGRVIESLDEI